MGLFPTKAMMRGDFGAGLTSFGQAAVESFKLLSLRSSEGTA
jgi:hypothetical protein